MTGRAPRCRHRQCLEPGAPGGREGGAAHRRSRAPAGSDWGLDLDSGGAGGSRDGAALLRILEYLEGDPDMDRHLWGANGYLATGSFLAALCWRQGRIPFGQGAEKPGGVSWGQVRGPASLVSGDFGHSDRHLIRQGSSRSASRRVVDPGPRRDRSLRDGPVAGAGGRSSSR